MSDRTDTPHDKYNKYPQPRQRKGKLPPRKDTNKNKNKDAGKNHSRDDRSITALIFPSKPNVRNTDTWQQICYWLGTTDLVALLMTGSRWMQQVLSETRGVKWSWHYYPILQIFKYISVVDLSLDRTWPLLLSAIAALPTSVTSLTMVWRPTMSLADHSKADPILFPPMLTSLSLTTHPTLCVKYLTIFPDTLTRLTLDMSSDSLVIMNSEILKCVQRLPPTLLYTF